MIPQPHTINVWRPIYTQGVSQEIEGYEPVYSNVPCFVQPADSKLEFFYFQRGTTITHSIYTTRTDLTFRREDICVRGDNQYHLIAEPIDGCELGVYLELHCEQYPEGAKKRLDIEEYEE